jgi:hypothetical protein
MKAAGEHGLTEAELEGLTDEERAALDGDDDSTASLQAVVDDEDDAAGEGDEAKEAAAEKAREAAEAKAAAAKEVAAAKAAEKAAAEAKAKLDAERAAMSEEDRKKAEAADKAAIEAAEKAKKDADDKAATDAADKAKKEAAAAAAAEEDDIDEPFVPLITAKAPEKYDERMGEFDKKDAADLAEFKDNKIEIDEFLKRQRATESQRVELREQKWKSDLAAESSDQMAQQQWDWECRRFMRGALKHEGIDYKADEKLGSELDRQVKALGQ